MDRISKILIYSLLINIVFFTNNNIAQNYQFTFSEDIRALHTDTFGFLYLTGSQHSCKFDGKELHHCVSTPFLISKSLATTGVEQWFASNEKLYRWDNKNMHFIHSFDENITVLKYYQNQLFIGTSGKGCFVLDVQSQRIKKIPSTENKFINDILIISNTLYLALDTGILKKSLTNTVTDKILNITIAQQLIYDAATQQVLVLDGLGSVIFIDNNFEVAHKTPPSTVTKIASQNDDLWGLNHLGIVRYNHSKWQVFQKGSFNNIYLYKQQLFTTTGKNLLVFDLLTNMIDSHKNYSIFAENDSVLWVGSEGKIKKLNHNKNVLEIKLPFVYQQLYIASILKVNNIIFVGTMGGGLFLFNAQNGNLIRHILFNTDAKNNINQISFFQNKIWLGYLSGIMQLDSNNWSIFRDYDNLLDNSYLYQFVPLSLDSFYLATSNKGILHYDKGEIKIFFNLHTIYSILYYQNELIATVENKGVAKLLNNKLSWINTVNGLRSQNILNIGKANNLLWLTHDKGIDFYNNKTHKINYLPTINTDENHLHAQSESENYWFIGYENSILQISKRFIPYLFQENPIHLRVKVFDKEISNDINLTYNQNTVSFNFESLNYYTPNATYYRYRLIGLDSLWKSSTQEMVNFYNLKPGKYEFQVSQPIIQSSNTQNIKKFNFTISQPFWQKGWFWIINLLLFIFLLKKFVKIREKNLFKQQEIQNTQLKFELEKLKNQINPHFLFNSFNSLIGLIEENPKKATQTLEKLSLLFRNILKYEKAELISIAEELAIAEQYFEIHKIRYQDLIRLQISTINDAHKKWIIPMSSQLLIENVIKHNVINKNHPLIIEIFETESHLVFRNNINPKQTNNLHNNGVGLQNLIKRNELVLQKTPEIQQDKTFFNVKIPFLYD